MGRSLILILILFSSIVFSQTQEKPKVVKIDEFGNANECEYRNRLDTLLNEWLANQKPKIYIIQYSGVKGLPVDFNGRRLRINEKIIRDHFRLRTENKDLATFINGGFRENFTQELWLVPEGAAFPKPSNTLPKPTIPTNRTFQFAFEYLMNEYGVPNEFLKAKDRAETLKAEIEQGIERNKNGEIISTEGEIILSADSADIKFDWAIDDFGAILRERTDSAGTIIFYADSEQYSVKNIRRHVEEGKKRIAKEADISPNRIQIVFGGYRNMPQAEFWIIPRNGELPNPTPEKREN